MRALPMGVDARPPPPSLLLPLLPLLLLLPLVAAQSIIPTYAPSYDTNYGDGSESISAGFTRTLEPTMNLAAVTGRGQPSRNPTYPPSNDPTTRDFGTDFQVEIPGVDMTDQPGNNDGEGEGTADTTTPTETSGSPPPPVPPATSSSMAPVPVPNGGGSLSTSAGALVFAAVVGCATILLFDHVGQ
jgi:hypothetical protein